MRVDPFVTSFIGSGARWFVVFFYGITSLAWLLENVDGVLLLLSILGWLVSVIALVVLSRRAVDRLLEISEDR